MRLLLFFTAACSSPLAPAEKADPVVTAEGEADAGGPPVDSGGPGGGATDGGGEGGETEGAGEAGGGGDTSPADPCGDPSVLAPLLDDQTNPVLSPVPADADHGRDNIYAPEVVRVSDSLCLMWYGGQGTDGHDQIFLATSTDCFHWHHYPSEGNPAPVITSAGANHVNDPSVVFVSGVWYLYYTEAATAEDDRIHLATSTDALTWTRQGRVLDVGASGAWDSLKVGRPAVRYEDGVFKLWYDGNDGTARHVGLATSSDGYSFTRHAANPLVLHAGAVDVKRLGETYVMLREAGDGTYASTSADGLSWCDQGRILGLSGQPFDAYGQVTPFLYSRDGASLDAVLYGGASDPCWCKNRIAQVYVATQDAPPDPSAGCEACLVGADDCAEACREAGLGVEGVCAVPGSADPSACCACIPAP